MMHFSLAKRDVLTPYTSYDCEYFSATKWKTIDGVGFYQFFDAQYPSLSKV